MEFYVALTAWGTWAAVLGTWGAVLCAIFAVWWQVNSMKQVTSLQLFLQLRGEYESMAMQAQRARLAGELISNPHCLRVSDSVMLFFETLGALTEKKYLDQDLVWTAFGVDVCSYWHALRHYVVHVRAQASDNTLFWHFEKLQKTMARHKRWEQGAPSSMLASPTADAIREFLTWETLRAEVPNTAQHSEPANT
jgi:hypothetical protein